MFLSLDALYLIGIEVMRQCSDSLEIQVLCERNESAGSPGETQNENPDMKGKEIGILRFYLSK